MRSRLLSVLAAVAVVAGAVPALATTAAIAVPDLAVDGAGNARAIVAFDDLPAGLEATLDDLGVVRGIMLESIDAVAVTAPRAVITAVAAVPGVIAVEPQRRLALDLYASKEQINAVGMDTPEAYDTGTVAAERPGVTGDGVTVAVLDSGILADHPDFGGRVVLGLHFAFSEIQDSGGIAPETWDDYAEATGFIALQDEIGHGTHVASTVGGDGSLSESNDGVDLAGVAPGVEFVSMKVADAPFGIVEDLDWEEAALAAFDYIIRHPDRGIDIAQNSWGLLPNEPDCLGLHCGEPTDFDAMAAMIGAVEDAGVTVVFSAGNNGREGFDTIGHYHRPDNAILVGAACKSVDNTNPACLDGAVMTDFSSRGAKDGSGPQVDVVAPGENIMAAVSPSILLPLTECPETQEVGYYCISGTSMASPHVSGVAALMLEANPALTPLQVEQCLKDTAVDLLASGVDLASGHGMVDARAAVACGHAFTVPFEPTSTPPPPGVVERRSGPDRITTAIDVSRDAFPNDGSAAAVVLARRDDFADGLAGTPLAVALNGPLLLTGSDRLDPATRTEVDRLLSDGGKVVLLGGEVALDGSIKEALEDDGFSVQRLGGTDRYATAVQIANALVGLRGASAALIARGDDFPDALAAGPAAVAADGVVLLSRIDQPVEATTAWLEDHPDVTVSAIGGQAAAAYPDADPIVGTDRETTAAAVAAAFLPDATGVGIARRNDFADALTGGVYAGARGMPMLLTFTDRLADATRDVVATDVVTSAVVFGGEVAVSRTVFDQLKELVAD